MNPFKNVHNITKQQIACGALSGMSLSTFDIYPGLQLRLPAA